MTKTRQVLASIAIGGLLGAGLTQVAVARADSPELQFAQLLAQHQITVDTLGFTWAHQVCEHLDNGSTLMTEVGKVYAATDSDFSWDSSEWFVATAVVVFCPWNDPAQGTHV